jgi:hypothetical protein
MERGGRVKPLVNQQMGGIEVGPARVWLQDIQVPGLAMSRSIGDYVAQSVGVIPEPGKLISSLSLTLPIQKLTSTTFNQMIDSW